MSAFMCSDNHLRVVALVGARGFRSAYRDALSAAHLAEGRLEALFSPEEPRPELAALKELYQANLRSLHARYGDPIDERDPGPGISARDIERLRPLLTSPLAVIKLAQSVAYQSCEHSGWDASKAKELVEYAISSAVGHLHGYDEAPWAIP